MEQIAEVFKQAELGTPAADLTTSTPSHMNVALVCLGTMTTGQAILRLLPGLAG